MKVFAAMYNPNTWESRWTVLSLHKNYEGALIAVENDKDLKEQEFDKRVPIEGMSIHDFEAWDVKDMEVEGEDLLLELLNNAFVYKVDGLVNISVPGKIYNDVLDRHRLFNQKVSL
jgi:hypothetical protein